MNRAGVLLMAVTMSILTGSGCTPPAQALQQESTVLKFTMNSLNGKEIDLVKCDGRVVMIVNVASKCGYTSQYKQLQQYVNRRGVCP